MSISGVILQLEKQGSLRRYVPLRSKRRPQRRLFMSGEMVAKFDDPNSAINLLVGRGYIEAALTAWTAGDYLYDNGRGGAGFIKRLEPPPPEIWEIRVTYPSPAARIFCRFAEPDTLIATDMHTRDFLGAKGSLAWHEACHGCDAAWQTLFPTDQPFHGSFVVDYITENCDDFPLS